MKNQGLFIGWNRPVPGKEKMALELFAGAMTYFQSQKNKGIVEDFEPMMLSSHGTDLNGFVLVRCAPDKIQALREDEEFEKLLAQSRILLDDFRVVEVYYGDSFTKRMDIYRQFV